MRTSPQPVSSKLGHVFQEYVLLWQSLSRERNTWRQGVIIALSSCSTTPMTPRAIPLGGLAGLILLQQGTPRLSKLISRGKATVGAGAILISDHAPVEAFPYAVKKPTCTRMRLVVGGFLSSALLLPTESRPLTSLSRKGFLGNHLNYPFTVAALEYLQPELRPPLRRSLCCRL